MYSQQHTMPMTGAGGDHSSGQSWTCTQPTTSQTRIAGNFLQRLSERTCSLKPVAANAVSEEEEQPWGSSVDLKPVAEEKEEEDKQSPSMLSRSPSLPSLHHSSQLETSYHGTPRHSSVHTSSKLATSGLAHELPGRTPQHIQHSSQRAPLLSITPRQQTLANMSSSATQRSEQKPNKEYAKPKQIITQEKENSQHQQQGVRGGVAAVGTAVETPAWKQQLMREMLQDSPPPLQRSSSSPQLQPFKRNLFQPSPVPRIPSGQVKREPGLAIKPEPNGWDAHRTSQDSKQTREPLHHSILQPPTQPYENQGTPLPSRNHQTNFQPPTQPYENQGTPLPSRNHQTNFQPPTQPYENQCTPLPLRNHQAHLQPPTQPYENQGTPLPSRNHQTNFQPPTQPYENQGTPLPSQNHQTNLQPPTQPYEHQVTPLPSRSQTLYQPQQPPPTHPHELQNTLLPPRQQQGHPQGVREHKFKAPPAVKVEPQTQEVIVVNRVAYQVGNRLGRGGSSEVFQVTRQGDGAVLAIKCVDLRSVDDAIRSGYLNEITLLQRMHTSPWVVQLIDYELCEARQVLFVVMEKGARDLAAFLKERSRRKDLRLGTVEAFWQDMVEAVSEIHARGIIHSDLKPANFLLVGEVGFHQLKLIDFGIASSLQSDMTSVVRETPAGTLNYMSPEAVRGMQGQHCPVKINYKSDIWSLGCILYNLLYGRTPFQHVTHPALKAEAICSPKHIIEFPARSPSLPGDGEVPPSLLRTVRQCLSREPSERPTAPQLLAIKYCGCADQQQELSLDMLAKGLASLVRGHPLGAQLSSRLAMALQQQDDGKAS